MALEHSGDAGLAVLDLGREVGAAVIYTTAALDLAEIEIKPRDGDWNGHHTAVRKRPGRPAVYAALFFALRQGGYDVRVRGYGTDSEPGHHWWTGHRSDHDGVVALRAGRELPASSCWLAH